MVTYPLDLQQSFERRWASRIVRDEPQRSPARGTNTCSCGHLLAAPIRSTFLPTGVVNEWHCSACSKSWKTVCNVGTNPRN